MKLLSRITLLFCIFIIIIGTSAFCSENHTYNIKCQDTISAARYFDNDLLCSKNNDYIFQNITRHDSLNINNKKTDNYNDTGNNYFISSQTEQQVNLISYIYNNSYLNNKTKVSFKTLLSEVHPNAP